MPRKSINIGGTTNEAITGLELPFAVNQIIVNSVVVYMNAQDYTTAERERLYTINLNDQPIFTFAFETRDDGLCAQTFQMNNINKCVDFIADKTVDLSITTFDGMPCGALAHGTVSMSINIECIGQPAPKR